MTDKTADKLTKMRQAVGGLIPQNGGLFEDTTRGVPTASPALDTNKVRRERFTVNLPDHVIERARAAAYFTPGLTLSSLVERALAAEIEALEQQRGDTFPPLNKGALSPGRPVRPRVDED
jgi:post-segregation antitoxin (ccd killing protein)